LLALLYWVLLAAAIVILVAAFVRISRSFELVSRALTDIADNTATQDALTTREYAPSRIRLPDAVVKLIFSPDSSSVYTISDRIFAPCSAFFIAAPIVV